MGFNGVRRDLRRLGEDRNVDKQTSIIVIAAAVLIAGALSLSQFVGENPAEEMGNTTIHRQQTEEFHKTLDTLLSNEKRDRKTLHGAMETTLGGLDSILEGTPEQIADAQAELDDLLEEKANRIATAKEPLEAAQAALSTASQDELRFHGQAMGRVIPSEKDRCGTDGCGGDCGGCDADQVCYENWCRDTAECAGKACGNDGLGGVCGECEGEGICTRDQVCVAPDEDVMTTYCEPECRRNDFTNVERSKVVTRAKNPKDVPGSFGWGVEFFDSVGALDTYITAAQAQLKSIEAVVAAHEARDTQILGKEAAVEQAKANVQTAKDEEKAGKASLKALKKGLKDTKKEVKAAGLEESPAVAAAEAALAAQGESNAAKKQEIKDLKAAVKAAFGEVASLRKVHKAAGKEAKKAIEGHPHMLDMVNRYQATSAEWKAAEATKAAAQATVGAATEAFSVLEAAIIAEFFPKNAAAVLAQMTLSLPAILVGDRVEVHDIEDLNDLLGLPVMEDPGPMLAAVKTLSGERAGALTALQARMVAATALEEDVQQLVEWTETLETQVETLTELALLPAALAESDARVRSLREAVIVERARHAN